MAVASAWHLEIASATLLGDYSNALIKLEPLPLVARVATNSARVRADLDWMRRELSVANFIVSVGGRAVAPSTLLPPGPHSLGGLNLSFWEYVETTGVPPTPQEAGESLRELHDDLIGYREILPTLSPLSEAWTIIARPELIGALRCKARDIVTRSVDRVRLRLRGAGYDSRPLHGDAHYGNLWKSSNGPIWGDFEDCCAGPIEWDLACLTASSRVLGTGRAADAALAGYGRGFDPVLLDVLVEARTLQAIAWAYVCLPEPQSNPRVQHRLAWLAR